MREVHAALETDLAYTTIATVLDRLHDKDAVRRTKVDNSWRYTASRSREETIGQQVARLMEQVPGDPEPVLLAFLDEVEPEVLDRLEALLRSRRGRR